MPFRKKLIFSKGKRLSKVKLPNDDFNNLFITYLNELSGMDDVLYSGAVSPPTKKVYKWNDFVTALEFMITTGIDNKYFYLGEADSDSSTKLAIGLSNVAAFIAQSMQETIQYNACDENNLSGGSIVNPVTNATDTLNYAYGSSDPNNVSSDTAHPYPISASCGQLGQSYQNYTCSDSCEIKSDMTQTAFTSATWPGSPPGMQCAPKSNTTATLYANSTPPCPSDKPKCPCDEDETKCFSKEDWYCNMWPEGVKAGSKLLCCKRDISCREPTLIDPVYQDTGILLYNDNDGSKTTGFWPILKNFPSYSESGNGYNCAKAGDKDAGARCVETQNSIPRNDVEGCCWWGRGVIQTTGACNYGKLNKAIGSASNVDTFGKHNLCENPGAICDPTSDPKLKWIAGLYFWVTNVQKYPEGATSEVTDKPIYNDWRFNDKIKEYVATKGDDKQLFINAISGIVNRGCPIQSVEEKCPTSGLVDGVSKRSGNFVNMIEKLAISWPDT